MKNKLLFLVSFFCISNKSEIFIQLQYFDYKNTKLQDTLKEKKYRSGIEKNVNQQQIIIEDDLYMKGNLSVAGVITAFNGIKINTGNSIISGNLNFNPYNTYIINIGNLNNGGNINILTDNLHNVAVKSNNIILQSPNITIPSIGNTLPLTIDSNGIVKTLYSTKYMKENIRELYFNLSDIDFLQTYSFNYTKESGLSGSNEWGFIAEDFENTPLDEIIIKNDDGKIININDRKILTFVSAITKELVKKIKYLEEKINHFNDLEKKINQIEKLMLR